MRDMSGAARAAVWALCLAGAACAPAARTPESYEQKRVLLRVPFFPDRSDKCGPAALAGVLRFWGFDAEPETLRKDLYRDSLRGSISIDLMLAAQARGLSAEMLTGGLPRLRQELDAGHPLIAFLNQGFTFYPLGHYVVVTGYDEKGVYVNSGAEENSFVSYSRFFRQWDKTDRWALLVLPSPG